MRASRSRRTWLIVAVGVAGLVGSLLLVSLTPSLVGLTSNSHIPAGNSGSGTGGGTHYAVVGTIADIRVHNVTVGLWPQDVIYDPQSGMLYVASEYSQTVSIVDPHPFEVAQVIPTGADARGLALDPLNHQLFVSNDYSSNLTLINTTTDSVQTTLDYAPYGYMVEEQVDPSTGQLLVIANNPPDSILSINASTYNLTRVLPIQPNPGGGSVNAINESTHVIYFPARGDFSVAEIGELNGTTFANVPLPGSEGPTSTFLDPMNGFLYVMLGGWLWMGPGDQGVVINLATDQVVATLTLGTWPDAYAYNPVSDLLYVSCAKSGNVSIINASTDRVVGSIFLGNGTLPGALTIDPITGHLYIGEDGPGALVEVALVSDSVTSNESIGHVITDNPPVAVARWVAPMDRAF